MGKKTIDIVMPSLGADMRDGTLTEWLVAEGDKIEKGDIIAVIESNKGAIDMESYHSGTIAKLLVQPVISLPVGAILGKLEVGSNIPEPASQALPSTQTPEETPTGSAVLQPEQPVQSPQPPQSTQSYQSPQAPEYTVTTSKVPASPVVRQIARQQQLELAGIQGSGPHGAILLKDIEGLKKAQPGIPEPAEPSAITAKPAPTAGRQNLQAIRDAIAAAMEKSKREIPHYYLSLDIDISHTQQWLSDENAEREPEDRLLLLAVLLKAVANILPKFPALNGYYQNGRFEQGKGIHIGNVISLRGGGLVVPAIHDVDTLSLDATMQALRDISNRSRTGHLRSSELTDATITITSIGDRGSDSVFGVIYPPQVAILGFGRVRQSPQVRNSRIEICDMITVSLSADHRVSDGTLGAKFLNALSLQLQQPELL